MCACSTLVRLVAVVAYILGLAHALALPRRRCIGGGSSSSISRSSSGQTDRSAAVRPAQQPAHLRTAGRCRNRTLQREVQSGAHAGYKTAGRRERDSSRHVMSRRGRTDPRGSGRLCRGCPNRKRRRCCRGARRPPERGWPGTYLSAGLAGSTAGVGGTAAARAAGAAGGAADPLLRPPPERATLSSALSLLLHLDGSAQAAAAAEQYQQEHGHVRGPAPLPTAARRRCRLRCLLYSCARSKLACCGQVALWPSPEQLAEAAPSRALPPATTA